MARALSSLREKAWTQNRGGWSLYQVSLLVISSTFVGSDVALRANLGLVWAGGGSCFSTFSRLLFAFFGQGIIVGSWWCQKIGGSSLLILHFLNNAAPTTRLKCSSSGICLQIMVLLPTNSPGPTLNSVDGERQYLGGFFRRIWRSCQIKSALCKRLIRRCQAGEVICGTPLVFCNVFLPKDNPSTSFDRAVIRTTKNNII